METVDTIEERDATLQAREHALRERLRALPSILIGYSGGVDSTYLAAVAVEALGPERVLAVTGRSASYPESQWRTAVAVAEHLGLPHMSVPTREFDDPSYTSNPANRCYFCKRELWQRLREVAEARGLVAVVDGSNADDAHDYRPGFQAAAEWRVLSPLLDVGLTKRMIRELSRQRGLPTWDQPAAPCLSSRIPYGLAVTPERLRQIEHAEQRLRTRGFRTFRVRHHGDAARLEIAAEEMPRAVRLARTLVGDLRDAGFTRVLLDVEGFRSGSLNVALPVVQPTS